MRHVGTQPIETPRLHLRRFTADDADAMFNGWASDPRVTRYLRFTPHQSPEESCTLLEGWEAEYVREDYYSWAVKRKEDGILIGSIGIIPGDEDERLHGLWEPGYCFAYDCWGQGYGTEALRAVVDYFMEATGAARMCCGHAKENPASGRVMEKAGFVYSFDGVYHRLDGSVVPAKYYLLERQQQTTEP